MTTALAKIVFADRRFSRHRHGGLFRSPLSFDSMEVLRSATTVPARYLGKSDLLGGVAKGKRADLVLLDANPLDDIANTAAISGMVFRGEWLGRDVLDRLLDSTRTTNGD